MRAVKPFKLGMLTRPFELRREFYLGVSVLGWSPLARGDLQPLLPEPEMWAAVTEDLGDVPLDVGLPKSRGEVLVTGSVHPPGGAPATTCPARVRLGPIDKSIYAIGDRHWERGVPTEPKPFTEMPLTWAAAFGGDGYLENPLGRGMPGEGPVPLPNLELPGAMIRGPGDRPPPAGFGPLDPMWPQRQARTGTYGAEWLENHYPGFPPDLDWRFFQVASDDQQAEECFVGDEELELLHLHREHKKIETRLPGIRGRAFIRQRGAPENRLTDVPLKLSTVWVFPERDRLLLIWHGAVKVREDDAWDVEDILVAAEDLASPKPLSHYESVYELRMRRDVEGSLAVLKDRDLLPEACDDSISGELSHQESLVEAQGYLQVNARARLEAENKAARAQVAAQGLDPDEYGPPLLPPAEPPPKPEDAARLVEEAQALLRDAETKTHAEMAAMQDELRAKSVALDVDFDSILAVGRERTGPPKFDAQAKLDEMARMAADARASGAPLPDLEAKLADESFRQGMLQTQAQINEAYRLSAHHQEGLPARLTGDAAKAVRDEVEAAVRNGTSLAGRDFTGADLSRLDLRGVDLRGAFLENASLLEANLEDAHLDGAVLAYADLRRSNLERLSCRSANFGHAVFEGAVSKSGVDARGATLDFASFAGAKLARLTVSNGLALEVCFDGAELPGFDAEKRQFVRCTFVGAQLPQAKLQEAAFLTMALEKVSLAGADLTRATFYEVEADGLDVSGARMTNARFVGKCSFRDLVAARVVADEAFFREMPLDGADFTAASLARADFSHASLRNAKLDGAHAREARLIRTDLTDASAEGIDLKGAMLGKADLTGTRLAGANLFGADFARAMSSGDTDLSGANTETVRVKPVRSPS